MHGNGVRIGTVRTITKPAPPLTLKAHRRRRRPRIKSYGEVLLASFLALIVSPPAIVMTRMCLRSILGLGWLGMGSEGEMGFMLILIKVNNLPLSKYLFT